MNGCSMNFQHNFGRDTLKEDKFNQRMKDIKVNSLYLIFFIYLLPIGVNLILNQAYPILFAMYIIPIATLSYSKGLKGSFISIGIGTFIVFAYNLFLIVAHEERDFTIAVIVVVLLLVLGLFTGNLGEIIMAKQKRMEDSKTKLINMSNKLIKLVAELEQLAVRDGLTSLYNHRHFHEMLEYEMNKAKELGLELSLIFIDIDHFKHYNDIYGHAYGDKVLVKLAELLNKSVSRKYQIFRYGGEEFAIICPDSDLVTTEQIAVKVKESVERYPFMGCQQQPQGKITISAGIACFPVHCRDKEELVEMANDALYKAKNKSRNCIEVYQSFIDKIKSNLNQSEQENLNTLKTLLLMINARDRYTYGHSERVVEYVSKIARRLALSRKEISMLKIGAYLHDIGKINIQSDILNKKSRLTEDEMNIVKMHPITGAESVSTIKGLKDIVGLILHHHERFDGEGYPNKLKGNEIPLGARIITIADSFDAMTSGRPYHKGKTITDAILELKTCAGSQFDPLLVDTFVDILEEENKINISKLKIKYVV